MTMATVVPAQTVETRSTLYGAIKNVEDVMKDLQDIADAGDEDAWLNRFADRLFYITRDLRDVLECQRQLVD